MSYQDQLHAHLASYKRAVLGIQEPGIFRYRGTDVYRDHILPIEQADLNLLPLARPLEDAFGLRPKRHRYFHHLNSSQGFAYNLFLPFFGGESAGAPALLRALGQSGALQAWELEAIPDEREGTNLDARWVDDAGVTTFCEVKLSEAEFGQAPNDESHRSKLETLYRPVLESHVAAALLEGPAFFEYYQVLRNVWHLVRVPNSRLLFLIPRANTSLWAVIRELQPHLSGDVTARLSVVAIEDVLNRLANDDSCPADLRVHARELEVKYVPGAT